MKLLLDIPTNYFYTIDIETVRLEEHFEQLSEGWQSAWEYKNKQDGQVPDREELAKKWVEYASLYAEFSKVCAVSLVFLSKSGTQLMCKEFYGDNEAKILADLAEVLAKIGATKENRLVGHAAKYFDYPFLSKRYVINGFDIPFILDTAHLKPWESRNLCTNADIWKMGGTGPGSSLQALCMALGIPVSKVDLVGDGVGKAFYNKEYKRIGNYCSLDTIATFNVIRRIKKESIFTFEEVVYIQDKEPTDIKEPSILEKLYATNIFSPEIQQQLRDICAQEIITPEDKVNLKKIILAHYQAKGDKVAKKKEKEAEIDTFISTIQ